MQGPLTEGLVGVGEAYAQCSKRRFVLQISCFSVLPGVMRVGCVVQPLEIPHLSTAFSPFLSRYRDRRIIVGHNLFLMERRVKGVMMYFYEIETYHRYSCFYLTWSPKKIIQ